MPVSAEWLELYLIEAVDKDLCTSWGCTTCGAAAFRTGLRWRSAVGTGQAPPPLNRERAIELAAAMAMVHPVHSNHWKLESVARFVILEIWSALDHNEKELESIFAGSWAGTILESMQKHDTARWAAQSARQEYESLAPVRHEEKRREKEEQNRRRLAEKRERDRTWIEQHRQHRTVD